MGGNIIPDAESVKLAEVTNCLKTFRDVLPNQMNYYVIGSAGQKEVSSDIDVLIDEDELLETFPSKSVKEAKQKLQEMFQSNGMTSKLSGVSIHVGIPVDGKTVQFDLMVVKDSKDIAKLHRYNYDNDNMSGGLVQMIRADLARCLEPSLKMSPYRGLVDRETNEVITSDLDEMAKIIIDDEATKDDIRSVNRLLKSLERYPEKLEMINENYFQNA